MTNTEALRLIKTNNGQCLLVWSLKLHEIVGVHAGTGNSPAALAEAWLTDPENAPYRWQYVDASTVTLEVLRAQQEEYDREAAHTRISLAERARILRAWHDGAVEDLLQLLETAGFPAVVGHRDAVHFILENIYYARAASLSRQQLERLNAIAAQRFFSPLGSRNASTLECWLAVIEGDRERLLRYWDRLPAKSKAYPHEDFVLAAGDLQVDRRDILDCLVWTVANPGFFFWRMGAMLALGKIGAAAGETSAAAIEQHIYDSDPVVAAIRHLAIARIRTPPTGWKRCDACVKGKAVDPDQPFPWFRRCCECFGLGSVPIEAPPEDVVRAKRHRDLW